MTDNLFCMCLVIWLPVLMLFLLRNEATFKKNITVGVTFPPEAHTDPALLDILARYKKQVTLSCLALLFLAVPCIFIPGTGPFMSVWMIWIDMVIIVPFIPYVHCNKQLKKLKQDRGWQHGQNVTIANLSAAAVPARWLSPWWFILSLFLSLIPLLFDHDMAIVYGIDALMIGFCWFGYRYLYRNKAEMVNDNLLLTEALTRIRRQYWGQCWLLCSWFLTALNLLIFFTQAYVWIMMGGTLLLALLITLTVVGVEFRIRRLQERLTADCDTDFYIDDDEKWLWGIFYYDPNDRRLIINNRVGINTTVNLGHTAGKLIMTVTLLLLLAMPLLGVWIQQQEAIPVRLALSDTGTILAMHSGEEYEVPLDRVTSVVYLETLPDVSRIYGTGMDTVLKGRFRTPYGTARTCLNPQTGPYLLIETADHLYLFGSNEPQETEYIYRQIMDHI